MLKKILMVTAGVASIVLGVKEASFAASFEVFATGLDSPRGLTFDSDGALYITEAGRGGEGPCIPAPGAGPDGPTVCYGTTGAITRIQNGIQERVVTGLPSLALPLPDFGVSIDATGVHDIQFDKGGNAYVVVGLGSSPEQRDDVLQIPEFGQFLAINNLNNSDDVTLTPLADLALYEGLFNPDENDSGFFNPYNEGIDSNPFNFIIKDDTAYIVDAAGNDLFQAKTDGSEFSLVTVFPERLITDPFTNETIPLQSVPTSVALGMDGALYVSEYTGFPYPEDSARIFRIDSDGEPEVYAEGFRQIIDMDFDAQGNLYVLHYATKSLLEVFPSPGLLMKITPDGTRKNLLSEGLLFPTALEIAPDGDIYISNQGYIPGRGEILRVSVPVPEYTSTISLLSFGTVGICSWVWKKRKAKS